MDDDRPVARDIGQSLAQRVQRPVHAAVDRLVCTFARRTNVEDERWIRAGHTVGGGLRTESIGRHNHLWREPLWFARLPQVWNRRKAPFQETNNVIEADPSQSKRRLRLRARVGDDDNRPRGVEQSARPCGVLPSEPNIDAARQVGRGKFRRVSRVEELRAGVDSGGDLFDAHRLQLASERLLERRPLTAIQYGVIGEICGRIGLIGGDQFDEAFPRHWLQRVIDAPLIADRGHRFLRDRFAAQRPGAMRGIHLGRVRQLQQLFVDRIVEHRSELAGRPSQRRAKIGSPHIADK